MVDQWLQKPVAERREILEALGLVYSEQSEIVMILKDVPTHEPHLW